MRVIRNIHEWHHEKTNLSFSTFPMVHIGKQSYYDDISKIISDLNVVLVEGVSVFKTKSSFFSRMYKYKKLAKYFGIVDQETYLKYPDDLPKVNIDFQPSIPSSKTGHCYPLEVDRLQRKSKTENRLLIRLSLYRRRSLRCLLPHSK